MPCDDVDSNPGNPDSDRVGKSATTAARLRLETARHAQLARSDGRNSRERAHHHHLHLPADEIGQCLTRPFVWNIDDVDARLRFEKLCGDAVGHGPADAKLICPGRAFARAISSWTDFAATEG